MKKLNYEEIKNVSGGKIYWNEAAAMRGGDAVVNAIGDHWYTSPIIGWGYIIGGVYG